MTVLESPSIVFTEMQASGSLGFFRWLDSYLRHSLTLVTFPFSCMHRALLLSILNTQNSLWPTPSFCSELLLCEHWMWESTIEEILVKWAVTEIINSQARSLKHILTWSHPSVQCFLPFPFCFVCVCAAQQRRVKDLVFLRRKKISRLYPILLGIPWSGEGL